ncbi:MAG: OmpH family outer membrane protein [Candidatus Rokubacteria bacterium]|nr:OmpH family outer membrane protein [Candidatus Rokubacteria bacterium]
MTKRVAKVLTLFVMTVGVCASPLAAGEAWAQGAARVAYIDVQRILARSSAGVAAREQLEKDKAAMQKDVDGKRGEVEKLREEIEKKGALLSADARKEKQETLERKVHDLRRIVDDYRAELERKEQGLLQKGRQAERLSHDRREARRRSDLRRSRGGPHRRGHQGLRPGSGEGKEVAGPWGTGEDRTPWGNWRRRLGRSWRETPSW